MSGFKLIATAIIPEITVVRLYDETVLHIMNAHPEVRVELPSVQFAVASAVSDPTHIEKSRLNSYVFVHSRMTNRSGDPLRVPIKLIDGTSGLVKTAYFATKAPLASDIVWSRRIDV